MALKYFYNVLQHKFLDVTYTVAPDGTLIPYSIDSNDRHFFVIVLRFREISPACWRYTVKIDGHKMHLYRSEHEWWME